MLTPFLLWSHSRLEHGWLRELYVAFKGRLLLGLRPSYVPVKLTFLADEPLILQ